MKIMGYLRKGMATIFVILVALIVVRMFGLVAVFAESVGGKLFAASFILAYIVFCNVFILLVLRDRCLWCGSRNVWRNLFASTSGVDASDCRYTHYYRSTYCYDCKRETDPQHWTHPTSDFIGSMFQ